MSAAKLPPDDRRCRGHLSDGSGRRCKKWAVKGGYTCASHGSAKGTPARQAARERLDRLVDPALNVLTNALQLAEERRGGAWHPQAIRAVRLVLDRAGYPAVSRLEVQEHERAISEEVGRKITHVISSVLQACGVEHRSQKVSKLVRMAIENAERGEPGRQLPRLVEPAPDPPPNPPAPAPATQDEPDEAVL